MKSTTTIGIATIVALGLICGTAFAQLPQPSPTGIRARRFRRSMPPFYQGAVPSHTSKEAGLALDSPALTLTSGIYTFPGSVGSYVAGSNKAGHIVGGYGPGVSAPYTGAIHGFLLKGDKFTSFDYPGAVATIPYGINDSGEIVGEWEDSSGYGHSFQLKGGAFTTIDPPGSNSSVAAGINKAGDIVGTWSADDFDYTCHGYLLSKGGYTTIDYPGDVCTYINGINNAGEMAGWYYFTSTTGNGFVYSGSSFTTLNYPGGYTYNGVLDINDDGLVMGGYGTNGYPYVFQHCYLYQSGTFTTCDPPFGPPAQTISSHLNDSGIVVGQYLDNSGTSYGYEVTVGP